MTRPTSFKGPLGFSGDLKSGPMAQLIAAHQWRETPLGPTDNWAQPLRAALSICLGSAFPTAIYWGSDLRLIYNDAWSSIPADRHPWALGRPAKEVWWDIWDIVGPQFDRVVESGEGFSTFAEMLPMWRDGAITETYWNYSFTPLKDDDGQVVGVFNQGHEVTKQVLGERRDRFLLQLSDTIRPLSGADQVIEAAQSLLGQHLSAARVLSV